MHSWLLPSVTTFYLTPSPSSQEGKISEESIHFPIGYAGSWSNGLTASLGCRQVRKSCLFLPDPWKTEGSHAGKRGSRVSTMPWLLVEILQCPETNVKHWERDEENVWFSWGVRCSTGHQGSRPCTVLSFLQVLFNSRKEAPIFWRTVGSCVLCRQIADYEAQYTYSLLCTSSAAALLLQVLLMEITENDGSASVGF